MTAAEILTLVRGAMIAAMQTARVDLDGDYYQVIRQDIEALAAERDEAVALLRQTQGAYTSLLDAKIRAFLTRVDGRGK